MDNRLWPLNGVLALLQFPAFFLYFPTVHIQNTTYQVGLSALLCLCSMYKATGVLGPLFLIVVHLNEHLFAFYQSLLVRIAFTYLYWIVIKLTHPISQAACIDRLVLFLLACLGSKLCPPVVHDHCVFLALNTMSISLTESLDSFRQWFGRTIEVCMPHYGKYHRRILAKLRVLLIGILAAVLLKTSREKRKKERNI